ncbi:MAG: hypothetical protein ING69_09675 [Rhodocyclaceae bacterium]|nr:hypothetical protein [Rhodocyclaceae bacterium]
MATIHFPSVDGLAYAFNLRAPDSMTTANAIALANHVIERANLQDPPLYRYKGEKTILNAIVYALAKAEFRTAPLDENAPHTMFYDRDASPIIAHAFTRLSLGAQR